MESIQPAIMELERAKDWLNVTFFNSEVKDAIITILPAGRRKALGWFGAERWENETKKLNEINISAEHLKGSPLEPIEVVVHELCHAFNHAKHVKDCTGNNYHNKHFKAIAEKAGLEVSYDDKKGYAYTKLSEPLRTRIESEFKPQDAFQVFRKLDEGKKAKTKMKKWVCNCTTVRCATELKAKCESCGQSFIKEGGEDE
jgi:hypothetical protein